MIARLAHDVAVFGACMLASVASSLGPDARTGLGAEAEAFRRAVEVAFRSPQQKVARLLCRPPERGRGLFDGFEPSAVTRILIAPVSVQALALREKDNFRRFDEAVFELSICLEPRQRKEICIIRPVRRRTDALCIQ